MKEICVFMKLIHFLTAFLNVALRALKNLWAVSPGSCPTPWTFPSAIPGRRDCSWLSSAPQTKMSVRAACLTVRHTKHLCSFPLQSLGWKDITHKLLLMWEVVCTWIGIIRLNRNIWAVFLTQCNILLQVVKMTILLSMSLISNWINIYENFCATYLRLEPSRFQIWRQTEIFKNILEI